MSEVSYTVLSHTADTGIEASAPSFGELLEQLAMGMFSIIANVGDRSLDREIELTIDADTPDDLVVDTLSELLYRADVDDVLFGEFTVDVQDEWRIHIAARGFDARGVELAGPPIKAVTYHDLVVRRSDGTWLGRVFFDV